MMRQRTRLAGTLLAACICLCRPVRAAAAAGDAIVVQVFRDAAIHFSPDSSAKYDRAGEASEDRGRIVARDADLPSAPPHGRIQAHLTINPVPQDDHTVFDRWDRAGDIRIVTPGLPDLEIVRFITAYGGRTEHTVDVSDLAPLLRGTRRIRAFIDTWTTPAWKVDVDLSYLPDTTYDPPSWVLPIFYSDSFNRKDSGDGSSVKVDIPEGLARVTLKYIATGHCTDGRDADEFISKANVISVDGRVVARVHPWRDDCRSYRDRNPYCSRWSDGSWSSDYSRSGWCPGTEVHPMEFDLTDHLPAGAHQVKFVVEDMRPADAAGNFGYWRISAYLVGWDHPPRLWRN